ncbi:MAG: NADPH:quinone reductase, partial [Chloroflexota bacterium]|nr:NADPH:quinone reductase [Chloroflexota bacterium]
MKAVWYEQNGGADILEYGDMPDPQPEPGEVRVRVVTSGVNPSDWKRRQGLTNKIEFPRVIPNQDGAGIIDAVGSGVDQSRVGERVWLFESQFRRPFGTGAEYTVQPSGHAIQLPDNTDFSTAAGLGVPAMTAHRCVFADGPISGKTVLVPGGAGAVGHYAIQQAKLGGATVISTVSSDEKGQIALAAGADHIVNYREGETVEKIRSLTDGDGVDHIVEVDLAANFPVSRQILKSSGVLAVYAAGNSPAPPIPLQFDSTNVTLRMVLVYDMPETAKDAA